VVSVTEQELRSLLQKNPQRGERALFDEYYTYVYTIVRQRLSGTGTAEDAEECVIDVFMEVLDRIGTVQEGSLRSYIGSTAKNKAINLGMHLNTRSRRTVPLAETEGTLQSVQNVESDAERSDTAARLYQAVRALGEPDAAILIYKFYYDYPMKEIAALLQMKPVTVRSRCTRALKRLRETLADLR
jgi:RNA polymerase sigma factor (sigma-70 family)